MKNHQNVDLKAIAWHAMGKYGFEPQFPKSVVEEVNTINTGMLLNIQKDAKDLRTLLWSSIDNCDSMDIDQLEYCERGPNEEIHIKVAIADVDLYVPKQSQIDHHAAHNGTSVYTGIETFPMLPDRLSKDLTSLLVNRDRMAVVVEYAVLPNGDVRHGDVFPAVVSNKAKLVYEEVGDWLEGIGPIPQTVREVPGLEEQLRLQKKASYLLKKYRIEQGALEFDTIEANAVLEEGSVKDLIIQRKNPARYLIEDFMIAANGTMIAYLKKAAIPMIQRIVRKPKNWEGITKNAAIYQETLPSEPDANALSKFLARQKEADPERFPDLSLAIVKLLGPGEYMMLEPGKAPYGHFSLAVTDYTHGTAPNRRYVDLINQRLLKSVFSKEPSPYTAEELVVKSAWLTDREKASQKVERFMRKAVAAILLKDRIGESFSAIVTGASVKGTYVRLIAPPAEGRVVYDEQGLTVGQKVVVRLIRTDPFNGFIDFECADREENELWYGHRRRYE